MVGRITLGWLVAGVLALAPAHGRADPHPDGHAGRIEEFRVTSRHQGRARRLWVYTPPGYEAGADSSNGLLIAFDGAEYLSLIQLPLMLDSLLAAGRVPPLVAVMIDDSTSGARLDDLANRAWFAAFLGDEVVPWVQAHFRVTRDPHRVIVAGSSAGGLAAAYVALARPDRFGNVLSQSGAFWRGNEASNDPPYEWLTSRVRAGPRRDVRFWLEVGSTETHGAIGGRAPSILAANRAFRDALRAKGYAVLYAEVPNGVHAPESWGPRLPAGIAQLAGHAAK